MKVRIKFSKQGVMKFIGHLDVMRFFQKAIRRANIPIAFTEGFSPHMIMSFASALGLGLTSNGEYMDIEVLESIPSKEAVGRLNQVMVEGMEVLSYRQIPDGKANNGMALVDAADYTVTFRDGYAPKPGWETRLQEFYRQPSISIQKITKKGERQLDIRPYIHSLDAADGKVRMRVCAGSRDNLKPELVMEAFVTYLGEEYQAYALQINREELYAKNGCSLEELGEDILGA